MLTVVKHSNNTMKFYLKRKDFIYLFLEKGKGRREGEKCQCVVASRTPPTGDLAHNLCMCPNRNQSHTSWGKSLIF